MRASTIIAGLAATAAPALAQRPTNTSVCDYYTKALLNESNAKNQLTVVTLLVNTAVIGNYYAASNMSVKVPGILASNATYNGVSVNLAKYFTGELASTNRNGSAVAVNFLDGGAAAPLKMNMAANDTTSNQYRLLTHLYQYIGVLLGCSAMDYPKYEGSGSQASVHRYMNLDPNEMGYFIQQVALSAQSFGVAMADIEAAGTALNTLFNYRCSPPTTVVKSQGDMLQSMCQAEECPLDPKATCAAYANFPTAAPSTATAPATIKPTGATSTSAVVAPTGTGAAGKVGLEMGAGLLALAALAL